MFDIDNFKHFNYTFEHTKGDEILKKVSEEVRSFLRKEDIFIRWDGDEFLIIVLDISDNTLLKIVQKIRDGISSIDFGIDEEVTISIGADIFNSNIDLDDLTSNIDRDLFNAKHNGKNTFSWCE
ncbi:diguanylate cyclase (GGDEF) domain-containing protein [Thermodesulfobium acidiphilum]|uniref:diguanylate cyclase n=1 Tax=Thermodesulfobium acidiphilum TaxID=1794699 RepID=A0A2R4W0H7_THEAF|nr:diguanylate cyclase (GGDEF) domain-containing protein [Thermodesulfobium acidiphilum]